MPSPPAGTSPGDSTPLPITYDPETGRIFLLGEPAWFLSPEFYLDLQLQLETLSGKAARGILYRVSFSAGSRTAKRLAGPLTPRDDVHERMQQISDYSFFTGYGRYAYKATNPANAETEWTIAESLIASLHPPARDSVCHMYAGFLAGWLTVLFDRPVECVEIECHAKGDSRCLFRTRPTRVAPV